MIPFKLKMRNFMPYREAAVDFTGLHLAVITGDNGNGKSAIIDAITWALWGKARGSDTRELGDDALIHAGQAEMEVEFEFEMAGQAYRIIRKRSRPKKKTGAGQSALEFQIKSGEGFRAITGNTMTQTEEKITEVLHMDYDTFINSAYLRQGHADEFTRQAAGKRKEVLASILGLEVYDALEEKAKEQAKANEADNSLLQNSINEINSELVQRPEFTTELEKAETELKTADAQAKEKEDVLNLLRQRNSLMERTEAQIKEIQEDLQVKAGNLKKWQEQAKQHAGSIIRYEETIKRRGEIEAGYANFTALRKTVEELDLKAMQTHALDKQREQLERKIDQERNELLKNHAVIKNAIQELEKRLQALPNLKIQLAQAQAKIQSLKKTEEEINHKAQLLQETQTEISRLEAENGQLEKEIREAGDKLALIARHTAEHTEARCPLCEQELTREGLELIREKSSREKQEKTKQLEINREMAAKKRGEYGNALREKAAMEAAYKQESTKSHSQEEFIKARIKETEAETASAAERKQEAGEIEEKLASRNFAAAEQTALAAVEKEMGGLGYDTGKHEQARQQMKSAAPYERDKNTLDEAARLIEQEKSASARAEESVKGLVESIEQTTQKKGRLVEELSGAPQVRQELAAAEAEHRVISQQKAAAQEAVGRVRAKLQRLTEREARKKEYEDRMAQTAREQDIYRELAKAFGKNGIQALIIEAALPEIEEEANRLLSRLTDNRMTVKFETQRMTKKDTLKETLDIIIADELGTRNYEMFSGGEAFRINFAIRIALSRLLAGRAGAPLPTIIIDEGFGTQDNTGMEKLKEAIISIQDDFQKILVITHMDELKDAFPNRIDVVKTADGSTIKVS
jgi:DNA repair protein SbcC/Rad50